MYVRYQVKCVSLYQYVMLADGTYDKEIVRVYIFGIKHWTLLYENECLARIYNDKISINIDNPLELKLYSELYGSMKLSYTLEDDKTYCLTNDDITINCNNDGVIRLT